MSYPSSNLSARFLVALALAVTVIACQLPASQVTAATVDTIPERVVTEYINLTLRDSKELLAPARKAFDEGNLQECQAQLAIATEDAEYLPHKDIQLALWLFNSGRQRAGIQAMERVAMTESNRPDVRYLFAEIARGQGRFFDAWTHANAGLTAEPRERWHQDYVKHLSKLLLKTKAQTADARGDWENSRLLHRQLAGMGERSLAMDLALGRAAFHQDEPEKAEAHFRRAKEVQKANLVPELAMASLYNAKGDLAQAEVWFQRADQSDSDTADSVRLEYVRWLLRQNRADDARAQASKRKPGEKRLRDYQYMIALTDRMKGDFVSAERILAKLHGENADNFQVANQLALVLIESDDDGKRGRAMVLARSNVKKAPKSADAVATYAWVLHRLGESAEAEKTFNVILQGGQASRDVAYYVAKVKQALKKDKEAEALLGAAKASSGEFFNAFRVDE